jgi:hypothetical protein
MLLVWAAAALTLQGMSSPERLRKRDRKVVKKAKQLGSTEQSLSSSSNAFKVAHLPLTLSALCCLREACSIQVQLLNLFQPDIQVSVQGAVTVAHKSAPINMPSPVVFL